ncbi:MAG TPA: CHAT domain-containing protein [Pyrinomonadaceae bacterium]
MFDERAFISRVESASPEELANILMRPTLEEEKALRAHLGDERYQRMHSMALKRKVSRSLSNQPRGNVVVIHGIMGAELSVSSGGAGDLTWVNAFRIIRGWLDRLRLSEDGRTEANPKFRVSATGIMKRYYGELLLSLSEEWNVKAFWFDWRKDLNLAADELNMQISNWFDNKAPVHIVAHSMGGLVARTFIKKYSERWKTMWDQSGKGEAGGRLVMLGTPNHGSFAIPQVITGLEGLVRKLALLDFRHNKHDLLSTFNSFVGSYQMLPSPLVMPGQSVENLYNSGSYSKFNVTVPQSHLDNAREHHRWLSDVIDFERMVYVAGYDQPTFYDIQDWSRLDRTEGYQVTLDGDGRVPHRLGLLRSADQTKTVRTYYIKEEHGNLSANAKILAALDQLLSTGETTALLSSLPLGRAVEQSQKKLRDQYDATQRADAERLQISLRRMDNRGVRSEFDVDAPISVEQTERDMAAPSLVSPEERKVEETITRGFLAYRGEGEPEEDEFVESDALIDAARIEIGLVYGGIESVEYDSLRSKKGYPVDAVSVGHYVGVQPQQAEFKLDQAISAALLGKELSKDFTPAKSDLILTQYTERGIIQGKLGQPFILPDPRPPKGRAGAKTDRLIALAGMNEPGRFGMPELTVLARELCWALGRLNKFHLATVVIGAGEGNLPLRDAVSGWLSGIRRAVTGSEFDAGRRLQRVTFVEFDPRKVIQLNRLIAQERDRNQKNNTGFEIDYTEFTPQELTTLKRKAYEAAQRELERKWQSDLEQSSSQQAIPTRVTLSLDRVKKTYRFGAITDTASVPERDIVIDPELIKQANDELAGEQNPATQLERGKFLEELLMPSDLRKQLYTKAPLVMLLDATTARIHWEMVAQPALGGGSSREKTGGGGGDGKFEYEDDFLGTSRGFTRQLRTTFAPPPEPPPPPQHILRVLVVADPAEDAHLPGAQEEGVMVADLFESYNALYQENLSQTRVEVKRLFGPIEATRTNVLRELMIRPYDVLHFAGHCVFEWDKDPALSGWIFNAKRKELLTANELNRIDRIPKFVFSNACESGITPDRSQERNDQLAPSFAEAFFARGVANFVCTAWPVDDAAARIFALTLYAGLLGVDPSAPDILAPQGRPEAFPMHEAMKQARLAIARTPNGRTTWGAYQHYGNPYFQFFYSNSDGKGQDKNTDARSRSAEALSKPARSSKKAATRSKKSSKKASRKGSKKASK